MKEIGKVVKIEDDFIYVELSKKDYCSKCWRCVEEFENEDELLESDDVDYDDLKVRQVLALRNDKGIELYDRVEIEVSDNIFYVNLLIEFVMPIGDFLIGYFLGYYLSLYVEYSQPSTNGLAAGAIFFTLSFWLARFFSSDILISWNKYPRVIRIIKDISLGDDAAGCKF